MIKEAPVLLPLALMIMFAATKALAQDDDAVKHARALLRATPLIDGHNDLPWVIRNYKEAPMDVEAYDLRKATPHDTDLERLKSGQVGAQFWSVFIPGESQKEGYAKLQLEQIDLALRMVEKYPKDLSLALTADDILTAFKQGKIASLLGAEGGHAIENSLGALRTFFRLGVRYMTLTHNVTLDWADSAGDTELHNGLTEFGREVVREMNRLGMMVDLSHVTPKVMHDVLDLSESPIVFSHSSAKKLVDHPRNVPDDVLERLPENGGIVMVTFIPSFVSAKVKAWQDPLTELLKGVPFDERWHQIKDDYVKAHQPKPKATLADVADHIEHIRKIAGIDHVGIGSDYWGSGDMPEGLADVSRFPHLLAELIRRGWTDKEIKKLAGNNMLRVMKKNETMARQLQQEKAASTATIN